MNIIFMAAALFALTQSAQQRQLLHDLARDPAPERPCVLVTGVPEVDCQDPVPPRTWEPAYDPDAPVPFNPRDIPARSAAPGPYVVPETVFTYAHAPSAPVVFDLEAVTVLPAYVLAALASGVAPEVLFEYTRPRIFPKGIK